MEIGLHRVARKRLKRGLGAEHARRPICFGVEPPEQPEHRSAHPVRHRTAHALFHQMHAVTTIATEALVPTISGKRHGNLLARQLTDAVSGDGRAVGIGLIVQGSKGVDQIEVV
ncbi:hypothetical protein SDC9_130917 [bioreactor metagenome]|uniref:Uncharacterized protein n=1 Tax=bioreactor metagenome TaxID=1076179 RepID=A0A645D458_9ZZZZ